MTSVQSLRTSTIPRASGPVPWAPPRTSGVAAIWRWLVRNVRVAFNSPAGGEHALRQRPEALRALIHHAGIALVTTRDSAGRLHTQPMTPLKRTFDGEIWFPTTASMPLVAHVLNRADIQVTYLDPDSAHRCVVLDGIARVFERAGDATSTWRARLSAWLHPRSHIDGPAFIRVDVVSADVWE